MNIRKACVGDAMGIASVHVDSWRTTYKGIISDSFLSQLSIERRKKSWEGIITNLKHDEILLVAVNDAGNIVGFSNGGRNRNGKLEYDGELYAIYLLRDYQGQGLGKLLLQSVVESLKDSGFTSMMVWVLEDNPSKHFYKALGGKQIGKKDIMIGKEKLTELAFEWNNISDII